MRSVSVQRSAVWVLLVVALVSLALFGTYAAPKTLPERGDAAEAERGAHAAGLEERRDARPSSVASDSRAARPDRMQIDPASDDTVFSGRCIDFDGTPLAGAEMLLSVGGRTVQQTTGADGEFRFVLDSRDVTGTYARCAVSDHLVTAFDGSVRLGENVTIRVNSSRDPDMVLRGVIRVPYPDTKFWHAFVFGAQTSDPIASTAITGPYHREEEEVLLTIYDPSAGAVEGGVELHIHRADAVTGGGGTVSVHEYASMEDLRAQLAAGITADRFARTWQVPAFDNGALPSKLEWFGLFAGRQRFAALPVHRSRVRLDALEGPYVLRGLAESGARGGTVLVEDFATGPLPSRWSFQWPGEETLVVRVSDGGNPVSGAVVLARAIGGYGGGTYLHHAWQSEPTDAEGRTAIRRLPEGRYRVFVERAGMEVAETISLPRVGPVELMCGVATEVSFTFTVERPDAAHSLGVPRVWLRRSSEAWSALDAKMALGQRLGRLSEGSYEVAVLVDSHGGSEAFEVRGPATPDVHVQLARTRHYAGRVVDGTGQPLHGVSVRGRARAPWARDVTDREGRFSLRASCEPQELRVVRDGEELDFEVSKTIDGLRLDELRLTVR